MADGQSIRLDVVRFTNETVRLVALRRADAFDESGTNMAELRSFFPIQLQQTAAPWRRSRLQIFALVCAANLGILAAVALGLSGLPLLPVLIGALAIGGLIGLGWEKVAAEIDSLLGDQDHLNSR